MCRPVCTGGRLFGASSLSSSTTCSAPVFLSWDLVRTALCVDLSPRRNWYRPTSGRLMMTVGRVFPLALCPAWRGSTFPSSYTQCRSSCAAEIQSCWFTESSQSRVLFLSDAAISISSEVGDCLVVAADALGTDHPLQWVVHGKRQTGPGDVGEDLTVEDFGRPCD